MASSLCLIHAVYTYVSFLNVMFQNLCLVKIWFGSSTIRSSIQRKHSNAFFLEVTAFHVKRLWIKFIFEWQLISNKFHSYKVLNYLSKQFTWAKILTPIGYPKESDLIYSLSIWWFFAGLGIKTTLFLFKCPMLHNSLREFLLWIKLSATQASI
jgi:hypothetical protein